MCGNYLPDPYPKIDYLFDDIIFKGRKLYYHDVMFKDERFPWASPAPVCMLLRMPQTYIKCENANCSSSKLRTALVER